MAKQITFVSVSEKHTGLLPVRQENSDITGLFRLASRLNATDVASYVGNLLKADGSGQFEPKSLN